MISAFTNRAFRFLSSEVRGLHAAAYVLAGSALLSSLLALVRDRLFAHLFGASATLDVYFASFRIPDLIFVAIGSLVSVYILIPELTRRSQSSQRDYIDTIIAGFSVLAVGVALIAMYCTPILMPRMFPQLAATGFTDQLVLLTRIMLIQPILLGLSNILAAITQTRYRYALYALSPLLYNLGIIIGAVALYPSFGIAGLAWGVVLGAALHLMIQVPSACIDGFLRRFPLLREPRALISTALISVPRALTLSMSQLSFLGLSIFAGLLAPGSIAVFMFAFNLQAVPLAIIGASYSVAAFPTLANALAGGRHDEFVSHVAIAARYVLFWSLPASALVLVLRAHIVRVTLGSGAFDWNDTRLTAAAFAIFALSLGAQGITLLLVRAYYAAGRTFVPFCIAAFTAAASLGIAALGLVALTNPWYLHATEIFLRVEGIPGSNVLALAIAYAVATIGGALALVAHFEYRFGGFIAQVVRPFGESLLAALALGSASYSFLSLVSSFGVTSTALSIFVQGAAAGVFGILVAALIYRMLGSREYGEIYASIHTRLWPQRAPETVTLVSSAEDTGPSHS
jgi:putative peptidoglycan lipid II flippase